MRRGLEARPTREFIGSRKQFRWPIDFAVIDADTDDFGRPRRNHPLHHGDRFGRICLAVDARNQPSDDAAVALCVVDRSDDGVLRRPV